MPALESVIEDMAQFPVDHVVVAGDLISFGPHSEQVLNLVDNLGWSVIRGNNEFYLLDFNSHRAPQRWSDPDYYSLLPWYCKQISHEWKNKIAAWPDELHIRYPDAPKLYVCHGTPITPCRGLFPNLPEEDLAKELGGVEEKVLIVGHTHLPMDWSFGKWQIINPGSVGIPLDGIALASYAILEG
jgi:putative phosphoesterase